MEILKYLNKNKEIIFNKTYLIMTNHGYESCCCKSPMIFNKDGVSVCSACGRYGIYM